MRIAIIYFSGTGVTEGYAKIMANELERNGVKAILHNITSIKDRETDISFEQYNALIFGFPVYGGRLPTVAETWLNKLEGKNQCSMFFTYGGRELEWAHQTGFYLLSKAKFDVLLSAEFVGPHSYNVAKGWDLASNRPDSYDKEIAKEFAVESLKRFHSTNVEWTYNLEDFSYQPRVTTEYHGPFAVFYPFKTKDCQMCFLCEDECPTNAFDLSSGEGKNGVCIRCMHCVTICPDNVIEVGDATELFQKFSTIHDLSPENVKKKKSKLIY